MMPGFEENSWFRSMVIPEGVEQPSFVDLSHFVKCMGVGCEKRQQALLRTREKFEDKDEQLMVTGGFAFSNCLPAKPDPTASCFSGQTSPLTLNGQRINLKNHLFGLLPTRLCPLSTTVTFRIYYQIFKPYVHHGPRVVKTITQCRSFK